MEDDDKNYSNRTDLQNSATSTARYTGQTYGEATRQEQSQQMVRPGTTPTTAQPAPPAPTPAPGAQRFDRPSERPDEPITAGADFGPGPNAVQAGIMPRFINENPIEKRLIQLYRKHPNEGLRLLIQRYVDQRA